MFVQRVRHQLLAGAGFTGDEHRDVALRQAANGAEHVLHGGRLAQHLGHGAQALFGHFLALAFVHGAADQLHRFGQIEGFGQVLESTALKRRHRAVQVGEGGHDDDRQTRQALFHLLQQIEAGTTRHADVAHEDLRTFAVAGVIEGGNHLLRMGEAAGGQFLARQRLLQHKPDGLVVIHDPDGFHARVPCLSSRLIVLINTGFKAMG